MLGEFENALGHMHIFSTYARAVCEWDGCVNVCCLFVRTVGDICYCKSGWWVWWKHDVCKRKQSLRVG